MITLPFIFGKVIYPLELRTSDLCFCLVVIMITETYQVVTCMMDKQAKG